MPFSTSGTGTLFLSGTGSGIWSSDINPNTNVVVTPSGVLGALTTLRGGTLTLQSDALLTPRTIGCTTTSSLVVDRATQGAGFTQTSGTLSISGLLQIFAGSNVTSGTARISFAGINLSNGVAGTATLEPQTAPITVTGTTSVAQNAILNNFKTLALAGSVGGNVVSGPITDGLSPVALAKSGTNDWTISGSNTFSGAVGISGGRLNVTQSNGLGGNGVRRQLGLGVGAVALSGSGATLNLQGVANNVITLTGTSPGGVSLINDDVANAATLDNGIAGISFTSGGSGFTAADVGKTITAAGGVIARIATVTNGTVRSVTTDSVGSGYSSAPTLTIDPTVSGSGFNPVATLSSVSLSGTNNSIGGAGAMTIKSVISGTGSFTKVGAGTLTLAAANLFTGQTTVDGGRLLVNGSILGSSGLTVRAGAELGGSGVVAAITGAGLVAPGNSPGILSAPSASFSGGLDFAFEFTQGGAPTWGSAANSGNDVLRLTDPTAPLVGTASGDNVFNIYFAESGQTYVGGIFTDRNASFESLLTNATFNYFVRDAAGSFNYGGFSYAALPFGDVTRSTVQVVSADFAGGTVTNGYAMQFIVVPEPGALALAGLGMAAAAWALRRRRT